jgi:hypothetical protein
MNLEAAADTLWTLLNDGEAEMIAAKKANDFLYPNTVIAWEMTKFHTIGAFTKYPRGGDFVHTKKKRGEVREDTSHKLAVQFEFEWEYLNWVMTVLNYIRSKKWIKLYFGDFAILEFPPDRGDDATARTKWKQTLRDHGVCNKGYNIAEVPGIVDAATFVDMEIQSASSGGDSKVERTNLIMILRGVKAVRANDKKKSAIQACFPGKNGTYYVWYAGNNDVLKSKAESFLKHTSASVYHQCVRWGMTSHNVQNLIEKSFDGDSARAASASRWDAKNKTVTCERTSGAFDEEANFRENFWGNNTGWAPKVVHETSEKDGEFGNFDFAKDTASMGESTGYNTVANHDTGKFVYDTKTVAGEVEGLKRAKGVGAAADDEDDGYESASQLIWTKCQRYQVIRAVLLQQPTTTISSGWLKWAATLVGTQ